MVYRLNTCYVGVDTFWTLITGWRRLVDVADRASSFSELREAGRTYGKVMGKNAARAFALLLSAAIGQTASGFAAKVPTLPGSAQASAMGAAQTGIRLTQVAQVGEVSVSAEAVTIALAPNAVASVAEGLSGAASAPVDAEGPEHHIATDKWPDATHSGGPWIPKFQQIFDRAEMSLNDPANRVRINGHKGPHPQAYHEEVYERLDRATSTVKVESQPDNYFVLNALRMPRCIDDAACDEVQYWTAEDGQPDLVGEYRVVAGLRIDPTKVGHARVFRPWGWPVVLIVSEDIKTALEAIGVTGTKFSDVV